MPIDVRWHTDDPNVLLMEFAGSWRFHELERACLKTHDMANSIAGNIYCIVYATEPFIIPSSFRISQLTLITNRPAASRCVKRVHIIAHKPHIHHMFNMYFRIYPSHQTFIKIVDNWQEAMNSIHEDQNRHKNGNTRHPANVSTF
ncbi:MAG: hypothetical protein CL607_28660 [Anaerolineaceae bacterium]|nr:hypothetical protein [Anaerolineaceae bacterium]